MKNFINIIIISIVFFGCNKPKKKDITIHYQFMDDVSPTEIKCWIDKDVDVLCRSAFDFANAGNVIEHKKNWAILDYEANENEIIFSYMIDGIFYNGRQQFTWPPYANKFKIYGIKKYKNNKLDNSFSGDVHLDLSYYNGYRWMDKSTIFNIEELYIEDSILFKNPTVFNVPSDKKNSWLYTSFKEKSSKNEFLKFEEYIYHIYLMSISRNKIYVKNESNEIVAVLLADWYYE